MSSERDIRDDLAPDASDELIRLAEWLERERPVPSASFRGELRRRLVAGRHTRPARLRLMIAAYAASGSLLLLASAISAAGFGPLSA